MKSNRIVAGLVAILVISALLAGCRGDNTQALISFTDDTGQIINLLKVPQRIVSIGPTITEILVALGASEKIVGIDDFSYWPSTMVPIPRLGEPFVQGDVISPKLGIDTDAIVALHPDLVIASVGSWVRASESVPWGSQVPFPGLDKAGITAVYLNPVVGVTVAPKLLLSLGAIVGESDKANELVTAYEKRKLAVLERVQNLPKVRVVLAWGYGGGPPAPGLPVAEDDPLSELIQLAGGVNVFTSSPEDKQMLMKFSEDPFTLEPYIAKNPEVILVIGGLDQWQLDRPGWEKVDAVQKGRVYAIGEITPLTVLDRLEEIAKLLHPGIDSAK
ncbi:MAG: ABC transporter substrate-binding protein [Dehalococcoidales bacterium]|nr:ABC transporter substrate-binding protein [Dehalococcoidales bacterium]